MARNASLSFIPSSADLDPRVAAILDRAAKAAAGRHTLQNLTGATASWFRRSRSLTLRLESRVDLAQHVHSYDVEVRWHRQTVFSGRFSQLLNRRAGSRGRQASVSVFVPGEWERALDALASPARRK